jgi:hypothetical protein
MISEFKHFGPPRQQLSPDELRAQYKQLEEDRQARDAERAKQREVAERLIRAGSKGLIQELGLSKILPVDVAMRKRIARIAKQLRESSAH